MELKKLFVLAFFLLISCNNNAKQSTDLMPNKNGIVKFYDFDSMLSCGYFSNNDDFFVTADNGCIYNEKKGNIYGNLLIYLVPNRNKKYSEEYVNKVNKRTFKEEFGIYVYIIPKEYLTNTPEGVYQKEKYKELLYTFDKDNKKWKILDSIEIKNVKQNNREQNWRENFIKNCVSKNETIDSFRDVENIELNGYYFIKTKVSSVETGNPIEISFYFTFNSSEAILSIGTQNSLEAYCEGSYAIVKDKEGLKLKYTGEGTCTSDEEESSFLIKKENDQYYIKSKRFINEDWQLFKMKN